MRKRLFFFAILLSLAGISRAYDFSAVCGTGQTLYYDINGSNAKVTSQNSSDPYYSTYPIGSLEIPSSVTYNGTTYTVTSIGDFAFCGCSGLTSVTIPNSVTSIGGGAFIGCNVLTNISVANGNTVYDSRNGCNAIIETATNTLIVGCKNTIIPNSVTSIGDYAFAFCGLTSVTIPNSVTSIGGYAFRGCSGLTSITIPNSVTSIGIYAFSGCYRLTSVTIPNSVTSIGGYAFAYCEGLTSVTIPNSMTSIGDYAFAFCGLTSVTIPNSVTSIGEGAFAYCSGLTSVTIPNSVTSIGDDAFAFCGLTSVTIPNSVTSIGGFRGCSGLTSITIPNSVTSIGIYAFSGCSGLTSITIPNSVTSIKKYAFEGCSGLTSVTIPNSVTSIGNDAFSNCTGLTTLNYNADSCGGGGFRYFPYHWLDSCTALATVNIGNNVRVIPADAFYRCSGLTTITIPNSVTSIRAWAFYNCSGLTSITIPNSVTSIGDYAFNYCTGLTLVRMLPNIPPTLGTSVFGNTSSNLKVTIPCGSLQAYRQSWGTRFYFIVDPIDISVTLQVNDSERGSTAIQQQVGHDVACDSTCIVAATANYGYHFTHWSNGNTANPDTLYLSGDSTVTAFFERNEYTLTAHISNDMGTVLFPEGNVALYGDTLMAVASPDAHYHAVSWSVDTNIIAVSPNRDTIWVRMMGDCSVTAYVAIDTHTVSVVSSDIARGSVSASGSVFVYGTPCTVEATAYTGYTFAGWSNGITANPYVFAVISDVELTALFVTEGEMTYTVAVMSADLSMGTVSGGGSYISGATATLTATANAGYHFVSWNDGNTANPRTVTVTADATYTAIFAPNQSQTQYTITATANDATMGTVSGGGSYTSGATATLTATANTGYHFVSWNDGNTANPRTVTVTADATYMALFEADQSDAPQIAYVGVDATGHNIVNWTPQQGTTPTQYRVYREGTQEGVYDPVGVVQANGATSYSWSDDQSNPAIRAYSYRLTEVTADGTESAQSATHTTMHLQINQGQNNAWNLSWTPYAGFAYSSYRIYRGVNAASMSLLTTLPATATTYSDLSTGGTNYYYQVEVVRQSSSKSGDASSRSNIVTTDPNPQHYTLTVLSADIIKGTVTGGGSYEEGSEATLEAIANEGYLFLQWDDGSTINPRPITVTGNATYMAYFAESEGIGDVTADGVTLIARDGRITISGADGRQVTLTDALGRIHYRGTATEPLTISVPTAGIYLLQVDSLPAKRIAVVK